MGVGLAIREDPEAAELRRWERQETDGRVAMRLVAIASALHGRSCPAWIASATSAMSP